MTERVHLVRHGQSMGNLIEEDHRGVSREHRTVLNIDWDADDWELTPEGHQQGVTTGHFLRERGVNDDNTEIWASPLLRAQQTARNLGYSATVHTIFPLYERKTVNVSFMDIRAAVQAAPTQAEARDIAMRGTFDGCIEPFEEMLDRIRPAVDAIESLSHENLVLVSHGYIMLGLRTLLEELDEDGVVDIFRGSAQPPLIKKRQTLNGDVITYTRGAGTNSFATKQHFGPSDNYSGEVVTL